MLSRCAGLFPAVFLLSLWVACSPPAATTPPPPIDLVLSGDEEEEFYPPAEAQPEASLPAVEEEPPTDETLLAKILRTHPSLQELHDLYTFGGELYLEGELDLAEEHFFLLQEGLGRVSEDSADSLAVLFLGSLRRKSENFVEILMEERFFSDSYAPIQQTLTEAYASLRAQYGIPEFLIAVDTSDATSLQRELLELENEKVEKWLDYFSGPARRNFQTWLDRKATLGPVIEEILEEEGLPRELIYLSMIESGLQPSIRSRASAVGYWQFISGTARNRGLLVNEWVDERRDIEKSTRAACRHLSMMRGMFGRWALALAAYNAGEYRIQRAIGLQGDPDYWSLRLPRETREYVPKFIAAARIGENPEAYGFELRSPPRLEFDTVELDDAYSLEQLAKVGGISEQELKNLNPQLLAFCTPPRVKQYSLRVPSGSGDSVLAAAARIPEGERLSWQKHRVRTGETLGKLARQYRTTVSAIMDLNGISNARRVRAGRVLTIPYPRGYSPPSTSRSTAVAKKPPAGRRALTYVVRTGDTLIDIAKRHDITVSSIRDANGILRNRIYAGQSLTLHVAEGRFVGSQAPPTDNTHVRTEYQVRAGDTLIAIGRRFSVDVSDLLTWNKLPRSGRIRAGEVLEIWQPRDPTR